MASLLEKGNGPASEMSNTSFVCGAVRLKAQQDLLEKSLVSVLNSMKQVDNDLACNTEKYTNELEAKRLEDAKKLQDSVLKVVNNLTQLKLDISDEDRIRNLNLRRFQSLLTDVGNHLASLKNMNSKMLDRLVAEEKDLWDSVREVDTKIDEWSKPIHPEPVKAISKVALLRNTSAAGVKPEVKTFQQFLAKHGGHVGGWNEEDHKIFLRLRTKHRGKFNFLDEVHGLMPDKSKEDINAHEDWYIQYEKLRNEQRQAVSEWRSSKKEKPVEDHSNKPVPYSLPPQTPEDAAEKKRKIEEWKRTKKLHQQIQEENKCKERERHLEEWKKKKQKQAQQKAKIEQRREERLDKQRAAIMERQLKELYEIEQRAAEANKMLRAYRQQDQEYIMRRLSKKQQEQAQKEEREWRQQLLRRRVAVSAERDPNRLVSLTEGWRNRLACKVPTAVPKTAPPLHLHNMPHLAVPSWRKGLG